MRIKLSKNFAGSWCLTADQLNDHAQWTRFTPQQQENSDRQRFEDCLKGCSGLTLTVCKELQKVGTSTYQYNWQANECDVLAHAFEICERLGTDLVLSESPVAA